MLSVKLGESVIKTYGDFAINTGFYSFSLIKGGRVQIHPARFSFSYLKLAMTGKQSITIHPKHPNNKI